MKQDPKTLSADSVIEKFGGIRPLAKRLGVAVSTVQGWKQRGVVPTSKVPLVLNAALEDDIDLLEEHPAKRSHLENESAIDSKFAKQDQSVDVEKERRAKPQDRRYGVDRRRQQDPNYKGPNRRISERRSGLDRRQRRAMEWKYKRKFIERWVITIAFLFIFLVLAAVFLLAPEYKALQERSQGYLELEKKVQSLNQRIHGLSQSQGSLSGKISSQIERFERTKEDILTKVQDAQTAASQLSANAQAWKSQHSTLDQKMLSLTRMLEKADSLGQTSGGPEALAQSLGLLSQNLSDYDVQGNHASAEEVVDAVRQQDPILGTLMGDIQSDDVKAAALLLTINQLREAQGRGAVPFEQDLALARKLAGDNPETLAAIEKLGPYAKSGILSQKRLEKEFKGLAGEIVMAKLRGEDASVRERALARFSNLVTVRRVDDLEGETTDAVVARAQLMLEQGNVQGAIQELQSLEGESAQVAQPWIEQAQGQVIASQAADVLSHDLVSQITKGQNISPGSIGTILKSLFGRGGPTANIVSQPGGSTKQGTYPGLAVE